MSDTHDVLDLSSKANRLELLDKAKNVRYDPIELNNALIDQLEHTRKYLGVSQTYFAELLGVTKDFYCKMIKHSPQRYLHVDTLITYCKLFGFDISGLLGETILNTADPTLREMAMFLSELSDETLRAMGNVIAESNEDDEVKAMGAALIKDLIKEDSASTESPVNP